MPRALENDESLSHEPPQPVTIGAVLTVKVDVEWFIKSQRVPQSEHARLEILGFPLAPFINQSRKIHCGTWKPLDRPFRPIGPGCGPREPCLASNSHNLLVVSRVSFPP